MVILTAVSEKSFVTDVARKVTSLRSAAIVANYRQIRGQLMLLGRGRAA